MRIVVELNDSHMPFIRQQADLHGPEVRLDFENFIALIPGKVIGEATMWTDGRFSVTPAEEG